VVSDLPGLDVGSDDVPVLCGTFSGQIDLGDQIYGNWDMFVAHLAPSSVGIRPAEARAMGLQLFPNPAHGSFKLRFDHPDGAYEVSVLDAHGAVVLERKVQAPEATFQLAAAPGLYLVRAVDQAGHEAISRLEVQ
jgi:hypothetical protein